MSPPNELGLQEFGFLNVNTAIANAVVIMENTPAKKDKETIMMEEMAKYVKGALVESPSKNLTEIKYSSPRAGSAKK
jgi:hypothetical protein